MLRRTTICGLFVLLAGLAAAQEQVEPQVLNPTVRSRTNTRQHRPLMTLSPPAPAETPQPVPAPAPTPFNPQPGGISAPNAPKPTAQPAALPPTVGPTVLPVVTYRDGLLTVQALNSTLGSVLSAIRNKTGIEFEGGDSARDLVAISLGPAPEGEVLSAIFSGSSFDFVALGRPDSPGIVQRVILRPNSKNGGPSAAANGSPLRQQAPGVVQQNGDEEENVPEEQVNTTGTVEEQPQDMPVQPPPVQPPPAAQIQPRPPDQFQEMRRLRPIDEDPSHAPRKQPPL